jgi:hypothetical protein
MLLFRSDAFGGTHELLPCGLLGGDLVKLFRKNKSKYYWYDFTVRGERYRGSTKEANETRAQKASALKLAAAIKGSDPLDRKPPTLREYAKSGTSKISLSSLALEYILRSVRSALLPFEADPGNWSFSFSSLLILCLAKSPTGTTRK